jgi:hypothetical protein
MSCAQIQRRDVESTIEERLLDEVDLSLDQLARWSGLSWDRVRKWADLEIDLTKNEEVRLHAVIALAGAYYLRCQLLAQVLDEKLGKPTASDG